MKIKISLLSLLLSLSLTSTAQTSHECIDFLYKYMPQPDKADYSRAFYEDNVNATLKAKKEMPWGKIIPEREFRHFVLPIRVNNEHLDNSRIVFYDELKDRVKGLSMTEAILEVNHWCHEKATYTPSDERTSSPLATVKTAYGRCGEESTFLVAALRSVCIPARQVYTPRWAHTDDNHAWVEAWADGQWHFLGACEPEPVLDLGWFNAPASRGMLMHTKAFGNYDGPEEVMQRTQCFTEIDVTANYAPIARREVMVKNTAGQPVSGAIVEFKIYNYAEFYTVSKKTTDANGKTYMQAGKGDLLAWAYKDGKFGFGVCKIDGDGICTITLDHNTNESFTTDLKIVPPVERNNIPYVSDQQRKHNDKRMSQEDSIRNAYVSTFHTTGNEFVKKSRGNYATIEEFLAKSNLGFAPETLLSVISDKDLRDITMDVLLDATYTPANKIYPQDIYDKYVLNPRVAAEHLTPYKSYLSNRMDRTLIRNLKSVSNVIQWTKANIQTEESSNPQRLKMTPIGVWETRVCDNYSRNIFFVSLCRTMGFAARIDAVTQKVEYYYNGQWIEVKFDSNKELVNAPQGILKATYSNADNNPDPKYYIHFTISKLVDGVPQLLNYEEEDTWQSTLGKGVKLDVGQYLITTGTRMADGSILTHNEVVMVKDGETTTASLIMPTSKDGIKVIGNFNSENIYNDADNGNKSILSTTGRGYYVLGVIAPNNEPTNHALRDIALVKKELEQLNVPIVLLFKDRENFSRFNIKELPELPCKSHMGTDVDNKITNEIIEAMHLTNPTMPVFIIADTFNRVVFVSQGYIIGLGEQLLKIMNELKRK